MITLFGSGTMWAVPTFTLAGNAIASVNATPVPFGAMQDVAIDMSFSVKDLYGLYQFPIDVARGTAKLTGKAKLARIQAGLWNQLFGMTPTANEIDVVYQESDTIGANNSANNVTVVQAANFLYDLGVLAANGVAIYTRGAAVANNVYTCSANGVYSFAANAASPFLISYAYAGNLGANLSQQFVITNQLLGLSPFFQAVFSITRSGKTLTTVFNKCVSTKLSFATKLEDFLIPEFDFAMMADANGNIGTMSFSEP